MTEAEWDECGDPKLMLRFLAEHKGVNRRKAGRRKLRLFGCTSCRQLWGRMADPRSRHAVELAERLADGHGVDDEVLEARAAAWAAGSEATLRWAGRQAEGGDASPGDGWLEQDDRRAAHAAHDALAKNVFTYSWAGLHYNYGPTAPEYAAFLRRRAVQADALRCIFGNPSRPAPDIDSAWLRWNGGVVHALAQSAYDDRVMPAGTLDATRLALLADALDDAGCADAAILEHLRGPGPHVRGCWSVDLVLGKR